MNTAAQSTIPDSAPYELFDTKTGQRVKVTTYDKRNTLRRTVERKNQAWGAYRYSTRLVTTK